MAHNRIAYNKVYHSQYGFMLGGDDWLVENNEVNRLFMYTPGNRKDDCDYSRFFGKGCVERYNYYHGSTSAEIRVAHVDCLQTFTNNGEIAQDLVFEYNTCFDFHQMCMVESAPHIGSVRGWTFRGNIVSTNSPTMSGGWGPDIIQTPDVTIENNTISTVRWAAIGLRGKESTGGQIRNNILCKAERAVVDGDRDFSAASPVSEYNLTFTTCAGPGRDEHQRQGPAVRRSSQTEFSSAEGQPGDRRGQGRSDDRGTGVLPTCITSILVIRRRPTSRRGAIRPCRWRVWPKRARWPSRERQSCCEAESIARRCGRGSDGVTVRAMKGEQVIDQRGGLDRGLETRGGRKLVGRLTVRAQADSPRRPALQRLHLRPAYQADPGARWKPRATPL